MSDTAILTLRTMLANLDDAKSTRACAMLCPPCPRPIWLPCLRISRPKSSRAVPPVS